MGEYGWVAAIAFCLVCAVVAICALILVWRQSATLDELREAIDELRNAIAAGDKDTKAHTDRTVVELRESLADVRTIVSRIEGHQSQQDKHGLHARDLGPLHDKINRVAEQQAETRGELTEVARMLREQLRILQTARGAS
jgi:hypothetical protein